MKKMFIFILIFIISGCDIGFNEPLDGGSSFEDNRLPGNWIISKNDSSVLISITKDSKNIYSVYGIDKEKAFNLKFITAKINDHYFVSVNLKTLNLYYFSKNKKEVIALERPFYILLNYNINKSFDLEILPISLKLVKDDVIKGLLKRVVSSDCVTRVKNNSGRGDNNSNNSNFMIGKYFCAINILNADSFKDYVSRNYERLFINKNSAYILKRLKY